jgi:hypothetical protein
MHIIQGPVDQKCRQEVQAAANEISGGRGRVAFEILTTCESPGQYSARQARLGPVRRRSADPLVAEYRK